MPKTPADRVYLTPDDIARLLNMSRETVYRCVLTPTSGLVYHRVGRRWLVGREAFGMWLNGAPAATPEPVNVG